ncbi:MAG: stage III sporulation protein AA [Oscillospiraceae bacterium]|nr:stage III sporulation protein AA [Oscillospiraceae bacterium]
MDEKNAARFRQATGFLHPRLNEELCRLESNIQSGIHEIRLRAQGLLQLVNAEGMWFLRGGYLVKNPSNALKVTAKELSESFSRLCAYSVHTHQSSIAKGFVCAAGGHRAGLCGTAVEERGKVTGLRELSSINLRVAGEHIGAGDELLGLFSASAPSVSLLIGGRPASGKTTILRDLARSLSLRGMRVCVLDERGEIAASYRGIPQNDVGLSDVLTGYPKGAGLQIALRSMNPQLIICDEVGTLAEADAIEEGLNAGVCFIAAAHAGSREDFARRPQLRRLLKSGAFTHTALLSSNRQIAVFSEE